MIKDDQASDLRTFLKLCWKSLTDIVEEEEDFGVLNYVGFVGEIK